MSTTPTLEELRARAYEEAYAEELTRRRARENVDAEMRRRNRPARKPLRELGLDRGGLLALEDPEPLVAGWLQLDSTGSVTGPPGSAKTFVALDIACCVATGRDWHGFPVARGNVLYVVAESARGFAKRVPAWEAANGTHSHPRQPGACHGCTPATVGDGIRFLPVAVQITDDGDMAELTELAVELSAKLIVFDTQSRCTVGVDENSSQAMSVVAGALDRLREATGACVLTVHHTPRNGLNMRGSNAQEGAATTILAVAKDGSAVAISAEARHGGKQKDVEPASPLRLELVPYLASAALATPDAGAPTPSETAVLDALRDHGSLSKSKLVTITGLSERTVYNVVASLEKTGKVTVAAVGRSKYVNLVQNPGNTGDSDSDDTGK